MRSFCLCCASFGDIEIHHVAGRQNFPRLTVPVCLPCHGVLSEWQRSHGVELRADADRTLVDRQRALIVGTTDVVTLCVMRSVESVWVPAEALIFIGRAGAMLLDQLADPDRPGRWRPDPITPRVEVFPVLAEPEALAEQGKLMFQFGCDLVATLTEETGAEPSFDRLIDLMRPVSDGRTLEFTIPVERAEQLIGRLQQHLGELHALARQLLLADPSVIAGLFAPCDPIGALLFNTVDALGELVRVSTAVVAP